MDVCTWFLNQQRVAGFPKVDKESITRIQAPVFLAGLNGDARAVDTLTQSLGATFLHEVRPTYVSSYRQLSSGIEDVLDIIHTDFNAS